MKKKERGITLVALVITIIILLILAGVTIGTLAGDNGLFARAKEAKTKTTYESAFEKVKLAVNASYDESGNLNNDLLKENLNNIEGIKNKVTTVMYELKITVDEYEYTIEEDGTVIGIINVEENRRAIAKKWLEKIGENQDKTIEEILENQELLNKLMNSKNAVDYMISKDEIMNSVLDNENAIKELSKSEYAGYKVITSDKWREEILKNKYASVFDEYSKKVEKLTDNTNTLASSYYSSEFYPYRAFDDNLYTSWCSSARDINGYIGYDFKENVIVYKASMINCSTDNIYTESFSSGKLQYFDDETSTWKDISENTAFTSQFQTMQYIYTNSNKSASKWILRGITSTGSKYIACRKLQFYARTIPQ